MHFQKILLVVVAVCYLVNGEATLDYDDFQSNGGDFSAFASFAEQSNSNNIMMQKDNTLDNSYFVQQAQSADYPVIPQGYDYRPSQFDPTPMVHTVPAITAQTVAHTAHTKQAPKYQEAATHQQTATHQASSSHSLNVPHRVVQQPRPTHAAVRQQVAQPIQSNFAFEEPSKYDYSYGVHDALTGDIKSHSESSDGYLTQGVYSLIDPDGYRRTVTYTVDGPSGFHAVVNREPVQGFQAPSAALRQHQSAAASVANVPLGTAASIGATRDSYAAPPATNAQGGVAPYA